MFVYDAYGLRIESEFALPELLPAAEDGANADVSIALGGVPSAISEPIGGGILYQATGDEFLLDVPGVARYYVRAGRAMHVEPAPGIGLDEVRVFLLGSAIGAALHQRGILVMHASAFCVEGEAVLLCGKSGAGTSTLLSEFLRRGRPMLVDDVCGVVPGDDRLEALPAYPRTRLWADAAKRLSVDTSNLDRSRPLLEKFERAVPDQFRAMPAPVRATYVLAPHNEDRVEVAPVDRVDAFRVVLRNTYRSRFVERLNALESHFGLATRMAAQSHVAVVQRPAGGFALKELADAIESDLAGLRR